MRLIAFAVADTVHRVFVAAQISSHTLHTAVSNPRPTPPPPLPSHQVLSIEKAESTNLLPNPVIVSVRTKKAFQLIELQDRDQLVDSLNVRLRSMQWRRSMFRSKKGSKKGVVSLSCRNNLD